MKYIKKISTVLCAAALGIATMTSCEGGDIISVNAPDWLQNKIDSIAESKQAIVLSPQQTTLGSEDFSDAFWTAHLTEDITLEPGKIYTVPFTNYSSQKQNYHNYYIILRDGKREANGNTSSGGVEYAVLRADNYGWGTSYANCSHSTSVTDWASWLSEMNGASCVATFTVNTSTVDVEIIVNGTAGTVSTQKYSTIAFDSSKPLTLDFTTEYSWLRFGTNSQDYQPVSIDLKGVPTTVDAGTSLDELQSQISATVTFEGGMTKTVDGTNLTVSVVPDLETPGDKYLVATYNKTFLGTTSKSAVSGNTQFKVVDKITKLEVTAQPTHTDYVVYNAGNVVNPLLTEGLEVTATYGDGSEAKIDLSKLTIDPIVTKTGTQNVKISAQNGVSTTVAVNVTKVVNATEVHPTPTVLGAEDCTAAFRAVDLDNDINISKTGTYACSFTNYTSGAANWNNWHVVLRSEDKATEYLLARADNYGWGTGYAAATTSFYIGSDWATWLKGMNGAKVSAFVTNNGNGTADVYVVNRANDGNTYTQAYTGVAVDSSNLYLDFTVEGSCLKFE